MADIWRSGGLHSQGVGGTPALPGRSGGRKLPAKVSGWDLPRLNVRRAFATNKRTSSGIIHSLAYLSRPSPANRGGLNQELSLDIDIGKSLCESQKRDQTNLFRAFGNSENSLQQGTLIGVVIFNIFTLIFGIISFRHRRFFDEGDSGHVAVGEHLPQRGRAPEDLEPAALDRVQRQSKAGRTLVRGRQRAAPGTPRHHHQRDHRSQSCGGTRGT